MKTVIEMAREIADPEKVDPWDEQSGLCVLTQAELERFAKLVRADDELVRLHEANQAMLKALKSLEGVGSVIKWDGQWELCIAAIVKGEQS